MEGRYTGEVVKIQSVPFVESIDEGSKRMGAIAKVIELYWCDMHDISKYV